MRATGDPARKWGVFPPLDPRHRVNAPSQIQSYLVPRVIERHDPPAVDMQRTVSSWVRQTRTPGARARAAEGAALAPRGERGNLI